MKATPVYCLNNVSAKINTVTALTNINLRINSGERVALVGSSGAGKSTLISLLNGTLLPSTGKIMVCGQNLARLSPRKLRQVQRGIGTVYQQFHLVDNLRVIHNVNAGHLGRWSFWKAALSLIFPMSVKTATAALTRVGIPEKLYARTDELSGGQKQRVALARVLVQNPQVILADEPISSLDRELSREIMDLLLVLNEQDGKTLVVSLHSIAFARSHCDRLIGLRKSRIVFDENSVAVSPAMIDDLYNAQL